MDKQWSAYELASFIEKNRINAILKISRASVYVALPKLEKAGYLSSVLLKESGYPEKRFFSITPEGAKYHRYLMHRLARRTVPFFFDFNSVLVNLLYVERKERNALIRSIEKTLERQEAEYGDYLKEHESFDMAFGVLFGQSLALVRTLKTWLTDYKNAMKDHL